MNWQQAIEWCLKRNARLDFNAPESLVEIMVWHTGAWYLRDVPYLQLPRGCSEIEAAINGAKNEVRVEEMH